LSFFKYGYCICANEEFIPLKCLINYERNKIAIFEEIKTINVEFNEEPKQLKLGSSLTPEEEEQFTHLRNKRSTKALTCQPPKGMQLPPRVANIIRTCVAF